MKKKHIVLLACGIAIAWQGCGTEESGEPTGTARVAALSSADVDRVDIYADDGDGAGPSEDQGKIGEIVGGALSVTITDIPVGTYNFRAEAFDVDVDPLNPVYEGAAPGVTITEGGDISINIVLQQVADIPDPFDNDVPIFQSFVFSPANPVVDEAVTLTVTASDADGDALVFDWTAPGGVTSVTPQPPDPGPNTDVESVSWTAPSTPGSYAISVTATDGFATAQLNVSITVDLQRGGETEVTIEYNNFPVVADLVPNPTRIDDAAAPNTTALTLDVTDDDTMTFQWTATDCAGNFLPDAQTQSPSFQITDRLGNDTCTLSVVIDDSRGGSNNAEVTVETGPAIVGSSVVCTPPPAGMVGWWTFDEDGINEINRMSVQMLGLAAIGAGYVGGALQLDPGNNIVRTVNDSDDLLATPTAVTVDAWINTTDPTVDQVIAEKTRQGFAPNESWFLKLTGGAIEFQVFDGAGAYDGEITGAGVLSADTWHHVAATFDVGTNTFAIYVDGAALAATEVAGATGPLAQIGVSDEPMTVGQFYGPPGTELFVGLIDELELFDRALDANEIQAIYDAGTAGKCKDGLAVACSVEAPGLVLDRVDYAGSGASSVDMSLPCINEAASRQIARGCLLSVSGSQCASVLSGASCSACSAVGAAADCAACVGELETTFSGASCNLDSTLQFPVCE